MNIAIIGTGYVADMYAITLKHQPELKFAGAFDTNEKNLAAFCRRWPGRKFASLEELRGMLNTPYKLSQSKLTRAAQGEDEEDAEEERGGEDSDQAGPFTCRHRFA